MNRPVEHTAANGPSGRPRPWRRLRGETGSALVTFLLLFPVLVVFVELIVLGGRVASTSADVRSAAREAARQASVASGPGAVPGVIGPAVNVALAGKGFRCQAPSVSVGAGTNFVAGGQIEIEVSCRVDLSDLDLLGAPGSIVITESAVEPVDRYRVVD